MKNKKQIFSFSMLTTKFLVELIVQLLAFLFAGLLFCCYIKTKYGLIMLVAVIMFVVFTLIPSLNDISNNKFPKKQIKDDIQEKGEIDK